MPLTIIILHGWGQNSSDWMLFKQMLDKDFNVVCLDLPGFGSEPLVDQNWTIPNYADWVISKINSIPGDKVLIGHSFGGRISSYIASSRPSWLKGLILDGSPSLYRPSLKTKLKIYTAKVIRILRLNFVYQFGSSELKQADSSGKGKIFRNAVSFDQTFILPKINVPTLLVWGEYDFIVPVRIAKEMKNLIPKSQLVVVDQAGHNVHKDNLFLFYGITKKFINSL